LQSGVSADHHKGPALVDAASILTAAHRSPELAETLLRAYLSSSAKTDDAPAFKVHVQLGELLAQRGDPAGAQREYAAALALAPNYAPARKAIQGS
jgi:Flp pilus assembly protein TadD